MADEYGVTREEVVNELSYVVEEAHNFLMAEFSTDWEVGEAYYAGKCDLHTETGRSSIVKTESRDAIRAVMPNIMRTLLQAQKPVEFVPHSISSAAFADRQSRWINQQFMKNGGYDTIYNACLESAKLKSGPVKCVWDEAPHPEHFRVTGITAEEVVEYQDMENVVVEGVEERESPSGGDVTYDIRCTRYYDNGKIRFEAFPVYELVVTRNAAHIWDGPHGHRRTVTVAEALEMGLEHDNWRELDDDDPRTNDATGVEEHRRGYVPNKDDRSDVDIMNHEFILSEIYCEYDMDGDGVPEKYVFYLGGTDYTYLHHEQIEGYCIAVVSLDPQPFTVIGRSLIDLTKQSTDNETAVLRTIVDNALIANNPRPAGDPTRVNFNDLMNNAIGAPIRTKGTPDIQYVDTPFTAQGLIPLLQYLEADAETRIGVTKAAQGLDPDAMQSTDKDAVRNTIALSQGQVELMVRNVVNTGLIPLFRIALRLATRHMDKRQTLIYKGAVVPVDIGRFDPELLAVPNVGLGTANQEMKLATLQFIYAEQKQYLMQMGMDNPFTSLSQIYNAIEDMAELGGITNLGRYFNYIDKDIEAVIARQMAQQAAAQAEEAAKNAPLDPAKALLMTEQIKARLKQMEILAEQRDSTLDRQLKALQEAEQLDFRRDDLAMERVIRLAEIGESRLNATIKREQDATSPSAPNSGSTGSTQQAS